MQTKLEKFVNKATKYTCSYFTVGEGVSASSAQVIYMYVPPKRQHQWR